MTHQITTDYLQIILDLKIGHTIASFVIYSCFYVKYIKPLNALKSSKNPIFVSQTKPPKEIFSATTEIDFCLYSGRKCK